MVVPCAGGEEDGQQRDRAVKREEVQTEEGGSVDVCCMYVFRQSKWIVALMCQPGCARK